MSQFAMIKLVIDIGLGASLLYLALRFLRGGISDRQAAQLASLDASLKALIREAEVSGNNLNDQLLRRQQSMESSLREIEANDTKLQRAISSARDLSATLDEQLKKVREDLLNIERQRVRFEHAEVAAPVAVAPIAEPIRAVAPTYQTVEAEESAPAEFSRVNIFGEEIPESTHEVVATPQSVRSALQMAVEKIVERKRASNGLSKPALDAVHAAAEDMLRTGRNLEAVAARTKLPLEEVRALSQRVLRDTAAQETTATQSDIRANDQRLGVLSGTRRQEHTA